jgi:hypothetical protein
MKQGFDKLVAAVVALMLVLPGALSARERRGANLVITLKDGQQVKGELIAVKPDSLLLLAGKDESIDVAGIREIKVAKKLRALNGAAYGFLAGAVGGIAFAAALRGADEDILPIIYPLGAVTGGTAGGLIGLGIGALVRKYKTIQLEGKSESDRAIALDRLRRYARIRDYK